MRSRFKKRAQLLARLSTVLLPLLFFGVRVTVALYLFGLLVIGVRNWLRSIDEPPSQLPDLADEFDAITGLRPTVTIADVHRQMNREAFGVHEVPTEAGLLCPYCRDSLSGWVALCNGCNTSLHPECLEETHGCTTMGCRGRPRRLAS
jgi:hypothetical protein